MSNPFSHPSQYTFSRENYVGKELLAPHELFIAPSACTAELSRMTAMKASLVRCLATTIGLRRSFVLKIECKGEVVPIHEHPAKRPRREPDTGVIGSMWTAATSFIGSIGLPTSDTSDWREVAEVKLSGVSSLDELTAKVAQEVGLDCQQATVLVFDAFENAWVVATELSAIKAKDRLRIETPSVGVLANAHAGQLSDPIRAMIRCIDTQLNDQHKCRCLDSRADKATLSKKCWTKTEGSLEEGNDWFSSQESIEAPGRAQRGSDGQNTITTAPLIGAVFDGRFHVTGFVGQGSYGQCWRATDILSKTEGAEVCIKVFHSFNRVRKGQLENLAKEAKEEFELWKKLREWTNPGIVQLVHMTDPGRPGQVTIFTTYPDGQGTEERLQASCHYVASELGVCELFQYTRAVPSVLPPASTLLNGDSIFVRYMKKFNTQKNDFDDLPMFTDKYARALFRYTHPLASVCETI
jgi:hypothetical protein